MDQLLLTALQTLNEFLTAGIAITAFSLLLYVLSFNLRDRITRSFTIILACVMIVFVGDALSSVGSEPKQVQFWLQIQWIGIVFLPAAYLHFSDAILSSTGRPSRGRRRLAVRLTYIASFGFLIALLGGWLVGPLVTPENSPAHLARTWLAGAFTICYILVMAISWYNFYRAYQRSLTKTSRRRMSYLIAGALAPALGSYPYLLFDPGFISQRPYIFWTVVTLSNILISVLLVLMAYAVAFFGVSWPDRVVKRRLFKWLMRGPVTASFALAITTLARRLGLALGFDFSAIVPVIMVTTILVFEHLITLAAPVWERWLFYGRDRADVELLQDLEERLLTSSDLRQFLESVLAAVCDRLQTSRAFIAALSDQGMEMLVTIGGDNPLSDENLSVELFETMNQNGGEQLFAWGDYLLVPMLDEESEEAPLLGLLGFMHVPNQALDDEQIEALSVLARRAALALRDRRLQQQVFSSLEALTPKVEMIQRLRAAARYDGVEVLTTPDLEEAELSRWVKDALAHYWGGPKLTESPLLGLRVVQQSIQNNAESPANALRSILRQAIDDVRPEGERRFTGEWILYNILEMKFLEGRKVRDIAVRLAMSEADLYRKQRVAIEAVANAIIEMEKQARKDIQPAMEIKI